MSQAKGGINRRALDDLFRKLGGSIDTVHKTGEIVYTHPLVPWKARANGRRKDAPRQLVQLIHRVERVIREKEADGQ